MTRIGAAALALFAAVSACTETVPADDGISDAACGADGASDMVGRTLEDMAAASFTAEVTRFINPGDTITTDVRPERMNIELDDEGRVTRVYCG